MPGRKSNISTISNGPEEAAETTPASKASKEGISVEDLSLPKSMIQRLAKGVLPANTQIQKDALLALHKSATVFVSYIASSSSENAQSNGKKTIVPQDVINALKDAEFESFLPRVEAELKKYNDIQCDKRNTYRRKVKEEKAAAAGKDGASGQAGGEEDATMNGDANGHADVNDPERPIKKLKTDNGVAATPDADGNVGGAEDDENDHDVDDQDGDDDEAEDDEDEDDDDDDDAEDDEDDVDDDETEAIDVTMEGPDDDEDDEERGGLRDEALDEPDSD
ncbi:DNA polymerase epsilon subunit D [Acrodontium crateriforme]|uniref:DNA polymerase epsilon subunit D n=1 Tax=Acrodontium crateriforme TaxID=150365 RepID=A0AAQ3R940_9PEZI|nr:DNA polymerase epsilon subunit D [Acrodontium crateriforme]